MVRQSEADASATRAFFVDMLVRDIGVDGAILDLIDNSVDAVSSNLTPAGDFDSSHIDVSFDPNHFRISDNCGGIAVEIARQYAFRFGRAEAFNPGTRIGEFGIGMKRAVFRLGKNFKVDSSTTETRFIVDVDVEEWRQQKGGWTFPMAIIDTPADEAGTTVEVRNLHEGVKELFDQDSYARNMLQEVADRYSEAISAGLTISLNREPADLRIHNLLVGSDIRPENRQEELLSGNRHVKLRIVAGIGPVGRPVTESGWYVYCNGRLVLKADRTSLTGWGTAGLGGPDVPAWHPQYARFRGFVFFTSDSPAALPWTTTKTEIDTSSDVYRNALGKMRSVIRRFATFTNELATEREQFEESDGKARQSIKQGMALAQSKPASEAPIGTFRVPERSQDLGQRAPVGPQMANIQFKAEVSHVGQLKKALGLSTNRQIGEEAFERLYEEEIG